MVKTNYLICIVVCKMVLTASGKVNYKNINDLNRSKIGQIKEQQVHAEQIDGQFHNVSNMNWTEGTSMSDMVEADDATNIIDGCEIQINGYYHMKFNFCSDVLQIQCFPAEPTEMNSSGDSEDDTEEDDMKYWTVIVINPNDETLPHKFSANENYYFKSLNLKTINQTGKIYVANVSTPCSYQYDINVNLKRMFTYMDMTDGQFTTSYNKANVYLKITEMGDQRWLSIESSVLNYTSSSCTLQPMMRDGKEYQVLIRYNNKTTKIYSDSVQSDIPIGFMNEPFTLITRLSIENDGDVFVDEIRLVNCSKTHQLLDTEVQLPDSEFVCSFEGSNGCKWVIAAPDNTYCRFYIVLGLDSIVEEIPSGENGLIGKFVDHSLKSYTGHFLYITGRTIRSECHRKRQAKLSTLWFRKKEDSAFGNSCNLVMNIKGNIGLSIVLKIENGTIYDSKKIRNKTVDWHEVIFQIKELHSSFFIEILTDFRPSEWNFIAIDDIYLTQNCFYVVEYVNLKSTADSDDTDAHTIIAVSTGSSMAIVIVLTFVVIIVRCQKKLRYLRTHQTNLPNGWSTDPLSPLVPPGVKKVGYFQNLLTKKNPNYEWYSGRMLNFTIHEIQRERLKFSASNKIGSGAFGEVFSGVLDDKSFEGRDVAIKRILQNASEMTRLDFFLEALTLSKFSHDNIVECIGISVDKSSMMLVLELLPGGDLKSFLRQIQPDIAELSFTEKIDICYDIVKGCQYLENVKFIHRDIAARNCLLTSKEKDRIVKVADFGLARDIMTSEYYRKTGSALLPVRWMPPESFLDGYCSSKSDVWILIPHLIHVARKYRFFSHRSYGVLMWEVFTYAQIPYSSLSNTDVIRFVCGGGRPEKPDICPRQVYDLMQDCWKEDLSDRPSFRDLSKKVKTLYEVPRPEVHSKQKVYIKRKRHNTYMEDDLESSPLAERN